MCWIGVNDRTLHLIYIMPDIATLAKGAKLENLVKFKELSILAGAQSTLRQLDWKYKLSQMDISLKLSNSGLFCS